MWGYQMGEKQDVKVPKVYILYKMLLLILNTSKDP